MSGRVWRVAVRVMLGCAAVEALVAGFALGTGHPLYAAIYAASAVICALCAHAISGMGIR